MKGQAVPSGHEILLRAITEANVNFADGRGKDFLFPKLLQHCVDLTESRFGFIGELNEPLPTPPVLHIIAFNTHATLHSTTFSTLELTTHLTDAIATKSPYVTNNTQQDEDLPSAFPSIRSFICIPLYHHDEPVGMLGLADRTHGYDLALANFLAPFNTTCTSMMVGYRRQAEQLNVLQMLENAKRAAEESALAKAHFLSNMSHEIRTPLNGIIGLTSLVLDSTLTFDQREMIDTVQSSGELLLSVVNDILDLAKFEAGKLDLHEVHFDIRSCIEACVDVVAIGAERKGIEVLSDIAEDVPATMLGDFDRVRQILTNLMGNAVKFTERGEVVVGVRVDSAQILSLQKSFSGGELPTILAQKRDEQLKAENKDPNKDPKVVHFWVRDTGIGIPRDKKDLLFKMYTQIDPYRTNGTGLGLAICKRLVEAMSGKIWATSEQGVGSVFHFAVPAITSEDKTAYYPPLKGKTLTIFSHLESHARVLQDFARQHTMISTSHVLGASDFLSPTHLQSLRESSAVIIDVIHADRIVAQLEKYFREGRASPLTPSPPTTALDLRGVWMGSSLTTATSFMQPHTSALQPSIPPLMLPKATLRVTQIAPVISSLAPSAQSEQGSFSLIPPPIATDTPATTSSTSSTTTTSTTSSTAAGTTTTTTTATTTSTTTSDPPASTSTTQSTEPVQSSTQDEPQSRPFRAGSTPITPSRLKKPAAQGNTSPRTPKSDNPPSKLVFRGRRRTSSTPAPRSQSPRKSRNASPSKGKYVSVFKGVSNQNQNQNQSQNTTTTVPTEPPLIPSPTKEPAAPKSPAKPILPVAKPPIPAVDSTPAKAGTRSTSLPKSVPPPSPESTPPTTPKKGMQQSKSAYAIAYINATQSTSPPSESPLSSRDFGPSSKRPPIVPLKLAPTSPTIKVAPSTSAQPSPRTTPNTTPTASPRTTVSTTSTTSTTTTGPNTTTTLSTTSTVSTVSVPAPLSSTSGASHHANLRIITNTGSSSNSNSNSNSNSSTPIQSPLAIGGMPTSSSTSSSSGSAPGSASSNPTSPGFTPPSSTPSTPLLSPIIPCPVLIFVPISSPPPRTSCANLFFLPKPIKLSRLSRKLEVVFENPQSPSTPSRIDRPSRRSSGSRISGEDFVLDPSMAIMHPLTIMVGEDNLVGQVVTQRMLSKLGYTAEFYGSGDQVLASLENRIFDVILLDLKMPGCDGFECARRICAALPPGHRPHIAAVTANILQSDRDMAASVGFNDYITKPFLLPDLARVLARCKKLDPLHTLPFKSIPSHFHSYSPSPSPSSPPPSPSLLLPLQFNATL